MLFRGGHIKLELHLEFMLNAYRMG